MSLHDLFRGIFGFPGGRGGRQPPPDYFDENEEWDDDDDEDEEDHDSFSHDFGAFGFRGGPGFEEFSGDDFGMSDMMKHFDEMFHTFDELFRQLGTVEFPPLPPPHRPGVPGIEPPPSGPGHERSLRDKMLKEPGAIPEGGSSRSEQPRSEQPTQKRYPQFEDFWKNPFGQLPPSPWEKPPSSPQDKVDKDLDAQISASDLETVLPRQQPSQPPQGRSFFKSITTTTIRGPDGKVEQRRTVRDGSGNEETVVTRNDGDQTHTVVTRRDPSGREETREEISDIDQGISSHPDDRWPRRLPDHRPPTLPGQPRLPDDNTASIFYNLFGSWFGGK
ncbi:PREDICTED: HCLS1-associated protein X-1-like [Branchiostoma belcheri]|uniref:HCLS1-associated protein X-1-like n=1 Tax=Branchiostoma belcheri TaxID=7741 RepID=A0A6P5A5I1_BRABE|nr:PREDICTED: HCLS1-associated protein X-1-like [Branchiostoma belcheri]